MNSRHRRTEMWEYTDDMPAVGWGLFRWIVAAIVVLIIVIGATAVAPV